DGRRAGENSALGEKTPGAARARTTPGGRRRRAARIRRAEGRPPQSRHIKRRRHPDSARPRRLTPRPFRSILRRTEPGSPRRRINMHRTRALYPSAAFLVVGALLITAPGQLPAQPATVVAVDHDDIGGGVRSSKGPEAGVWVIAETTELPTKYAKMVVTDDKGRYVIPDLPSANYSVWVRGYGLVA